MSRVGAPACVVQYEELFAMGLDRIVVFGTCGVLDKNIYAELYFEMINFLENNAGIKFSSKKLVNTLYM